MLLTLGSVLSSGETAGGHEDESKVILSNFDWPLYPLPSDQNRSVDYLCGNCRTVLLHAESSQVRYLLVLCTECGAKNSTDAYLASVSG
jgi:hypothetical protein